MEMVARERLRRLEGEWDLDCGGDGEGVRREERARRRFEGGVLVGVEVGRRRGWGV